MNVFAVCCLGLALSAFTNQPTACVWEEYFKCCVALSDASKAQKNPTFLHV